MGIKSLDVDRAGGIFLEGHGVQGWGQCLVQRLEATMSLSLFQTTAIGHTFANLSSKIVFLSACAAARLALSCAWMFACLKLLISAFWVFTVCACVLGPFAVWVRRCRFSAHIIPTRASPVEARLWVILAGILVKTRK